MMTTKFSDFLVALVETYTGPKKMKSAEVQSWITTAAKKAGQLGTRSFNKATVLNQLVAVGNAIDAKLVNLTINRGCKGGYILVIKNPQQLIDNLKGLTDAEIQELVKDYKSNSNPSNNKPTKKGHSDSDIEALKQQLQEKEDPNLGNSSVETETIETKTPKSEITAIAKPRKKRSQEPAVMTIRRTWSVDTLRLAYYIGILVKYRPGIRLEKIANVLTNNSLLVFSDYFKTSQELKAMICSGKLSTIFSLASDGTILYKPMGQGITSFIDLRAKYERANDIQEASLIVYDPYNEWRNCVNAFYVDSIIKSFTSVPQVCGFTAHWGCTPVALYNAWKEFYHPIVSKCHFISNPKIPMPYLKVEDFPSLENLTGLVTHESNKELECLENTVLLYIADLNSAA